MGKIEKLLRVVSREGEITEGLEWKGHVWHTSRSDYDGIQNLAYSVNCKIPRSLAQYLLLEGRDGWGFDMDVYIARPGLAKTVKNHRTIPQHIVFSDSVQQVADYFRGLGNGGMKIDGFCMKNKIHERSMNKIMKRALQDVIQKYTSPHY
jgi:hypothetical protein